VLGLINRWEGIDKVKLCAAGGLKVRHLCAAGARRKEKHEVRRLQSASFFHDCRRLKLMKSKIGQSIILRNGVRHQDASNWILKKGFKPGI